MDIEQDCELCHEEAAELVDRTGKKVCPWCAESLDYDASLTPDERRADHESAARYVDAGSD